MKRITDYLANPEKSLDNHAMHAYIDDAKREEVKQGRVAMLVSAIERRNTLDITDLLPYIDAQDDPRMSEIEGAIPPWIETLCEFEIQAGTIIGNAIQKAVSGRVTRAGYVITRLTMNQVCELYRQGDADPDGWAGSEFGDIDDVSFTPEERFDILTKHTDYARRLSPEDVENLGWYLICFPFLVVDSKLYGPSAETHVVLTKDGSVARFPTGPHNEVIRHGIDGKSFSVEEEGAPGLALWNEWSNLSNYALTRSESYQKSIRLMATTFAAVCTFPVLFAFSLANYQNIHPRIVDPAKERRPRQLQRELERRDQVPTERYHVLEIGSIGRSRKSRDLLSTRLNSMPLHVARGHFSHYGPEYGRGLLFGKYAGKFWIESHLRGSERIGIINKDYIEGEKRLSEAKKLTRGNVERARSN